MDRSPPDRPKAFSYIRMSTDIQLKGDSLRRQQERSQKYADDHGLQLDQEFDLHDIGKSGFTGQNIASGNFGRFLEAVRRDEIPKGSYLLVESFDRLSRQEPIVALGPFLEIVKAGINLVTLDDERVFSGNISFEDLIISIAKMSRANEESARKSDRLSQAWLNKRRHGSERKLTAQCPNWLKLSADRSTFTIVDEHASKVRRIYADALAGLGAYSIVQHLNEEGVPTFLGKGGWQPSTVNKLLSNKAVVGEFQPHKRLNGKRVPEGEPIKDYFPAIIPDETFNAVQLARLSRKTTPTAEKKGSGGRKGLNYPNLFSKLAVCAYCHQPMSYVQKGKPPKTNSYLACSSAMRRSGCDHKTWWRYDDFEKAFLSLVEKLDLASLVSSATHAGKRADAVAKLEATAGKQKYLEKELEVLFETSVQLGRSSEFLARKIQEIEPAIEKTKADIAELRAEIAQLDSNALLYYGDKNQIADLVEKVRSTKGEGVYRIRSQIASRLQSLLESLELLVENDGSEQQFEVNFRDGAHLMVFVDPKSHGQILQVIRENGDGQYVVADGDGNEIDRYRVDDDDEEQDEEVEDYSNSAGV
jgi:DNA invertase Pin-like site-specific DNA recombinase